MSNVIKQEDLVIAGFEKVDDKLIENRPPKIKWSMLYKDTWSEAARIQYLEKLSSTMNHAARLIQDERDELGRLCELKEGQLTKLAAAMRANDYMLQTEVTRMNEQRQDYNKTIADLNTELRLLRKNADIN